MKLFVMFKLIFYSIQDQHFQIPIRPGIRWTKNHYVDVLPANRYLFISLFLFIYLQDIKAIVLRA